MRAVRHVSDTGHVTTVTTRSTLCGKLAYSSKKVALANAAHARRETGENIRAYKCGPCHCWHIGHPPGLPRTLATS